MVDQHDDDVQGDGCAHGEEVQPGRGGPPPQAPAPGKQLGAALAGRDDESGQHRTERHVLGVGSDAESGKTIDLPSEQAGEDGEGGDRMFPDELDG
jgi:hypothetical protein